MACVSSDLAAVYSVLSTGYFKIKLLLTESEHDICVVSENGHMQDYLLYQKFIDTFLRQPDLFKCPHSNQHASHSESLNVVHFTKGLLFIQQISMT